jgi:hypothetical protein
MKDEKGKNISGAQLITLKLPSFITAYICIHKSIHHLFLQNTKTKPINRPIFYQAILVLKLFVDLVKKWIKFQVLFK